MLHFAPIQKVFLFVIMIGFMGIFSQASLAKGKVQVFYGDLRDGQMKILERVFRPKLQEFKNFPQVSEVKENLKASAQDILSALADPQTLGVIFLGHPAIKTKGEYPNKKIIHGYLKDGHGKYLPKKILSGSHPGLAFLSVLTCHESAILPLYLKDLTSSVKYYQSPTHGLDALKNPLHEFTSFYSTPKVLDAIANDLKKGEYSQFKSPSNEVMDQKKKLSITIRDLVSQRFSYTVQLDGKLIGLLYAQKNKRGRLLNRTEYNFIIPPYLETEGKVLVISPDDPNRPKPMGLKNIDDILVDSIIFGEGENLLEETIHLGDQDPAHGEVVDMNEGLGLLRNERDFQTSSKKTILEVLL